MIPLVVHELVFAQGIRLIALAGLAGLIAVAAASLYRWYIHEGIPQGVTLLLGGSAIALALNTTATLGQSIGGTTDLLTPEAASFTLLALFLGGIASEGGRRLGDRLGARLAPTWSLGGIDRDVSAFVRGGGRTLRITLPDVIGDIDGHDPVRPDVKERLAGQTMVFPGRLTHDELHEAFVDRLQRDATVGKVDVEFTDDGEVLYLAIGRGEAGIGHAIPPGQVAIAIRADPAFSAGPGDHVRVWRTTDAPERLLTGEIRGIAGDVVTLAVDEGDVDRLAPEAGYRLVTLPGRERPDREFAAILRRANETAAEVTVAEGSPLVGRAVGDLEVTVLGVETAGGAVEAPPAAGRSIAVDERVVVMGRPDAVRRFEAGAKGTS